MKIIKAMSGLFQAIGNKGVKAVEDITDSVNGGVHNTPNIPQNVDRTKVVSKGELVTIGSENIAFGIEWDESPQNGNDLDIDASVLLLNKYDKLEEAVYYGTPKTNGKLLSSCGSVYHTGDNLSGEDSSDGDDETILVRLNNLPTKITTVLMFMDIYQAANRGQTFNTSKVMGCRVYDTDTNEITFTADLSMTNGKYSSFVVGKFVRKGASWEYLHIETAGSTTLAEFTAMHK